MAHKVSATVLTESGGKETYSSGPAATFADADAELKAVLKTVVAQAVLQVSRSETLDVTGYPLHADSQFEDAVIVMEKDGPLVGQTLTKTRLVENMSLAYKVASAGSNRIDESNADVLAIASSFRDGNGAGGYELAPGESYFKN